MTSVDIVTLVYVKNRCLMLCRKRGFPYLIQPGGKPENGEKPRHTLMREVYEELGVPILNARYMTTWRGLPVAPDLDCMINITAYEGEVDESKIVMRAEIENYTWYPIFACNREAYAPVAPSLSDTILPYLQHRYS